MDNSTNIITCTGYYGTGSSAITDLMKEFSNCHSFGDYEFNMLYYPGGISELEYYLVDNNFRMTAGYGIERFKKNIKFLAGGKYFLKRYSAYFGDDFKRLSDEYINSFIQAKYKGNWFQHEVEMSSFRRLLTYVLPRRIQFFFKKRFGNTESAPYIIKKDMYSSFVTKQEFKERTQTYLTKLLGTLDKKNEYEYIAMDQLFPPSNIERYFNYYPNVKVVVVDRDPRDIYLLNKRRWKGVGPLPLDLDTYIKWYRTIRLHKKTEVFDTSKVFHISFEDLIYDYENSLEKLYAFFGIDKSKHTRKGQFLKPSVSIKNTKLYVDNTEDAEDIKRIEEELSEYLYTRK